MQRGSRPPVGECLIRRTIRRRRKKGQMRLASRLRPLSQSWCGLLSCCWVRCALWRSAHWRTPRTSCGRLRRAGRGLYQPRLSGRHFQLYYRSYPGIPFHTYGGDNQVHLSSNADAIHLFALHRTGAGNKRDVSRSINHLPSGGLGDSCKCWTK